MKLTDCIISPKTLGRKLLLVDVSPAYAYADGRRTESITGYRYEVTMPDHRFDKIVIKIDGNQLMESPEDCIEVTFDGLELFIYWNAGNYQLGAKATGIHPVKTQ